jgi:hypothetical protein
MEYSIIVVGSVKLFTARYDVSRMQLAGMIGGN